MTPTRTEIQQIHIGFLSGWVQACREVWQCIPASPRDLHVSLKKTETIKIDSGSNEMAFALNLCNLILFGYF